MPAVSKSQQRAAGAALAAKRGLVKRSELKEPSEEMYDSMTERELEKLAGTKQKDLPDEKHGQDRQPIVLRTPVARCRMTNIGRCAYAS